SLSLGGSDAFPSVETARGHHAAWRRGSVADGGAPMSLLLGRRPPLSLPDARLRQFQSSSWASPTRSGLDSRRVWGARSHSDLRRSIGAKAENPCRLDETVGCDQEGTEGHKRLRVSNSSS